MEYREEAEERGRRSIGQSLVGPPQQHFSEKRSTSVQANLLKDGNKNKQLHVRYLAARVGGNGEDSPALHTLFVPKWQRKVSSTNFMQEVTLPT